MSTITKQLTEKYGKLEVRYKNSDKDKAISVAILGWQLDINLKFDSNGVLIPATHCIYQEYDRKLTQEEEFCIYGILIRLSSLIIKLIKSNIPPTFSLTFWMTDNPVLLTRLARDFILKEINNELKVGIRGMNEDLVPVALGFTDDLHPPRSEWVELPRWLRALYSFKTMVSV